MSEEGRIYLDVLGRALDAVIEDGFAAWDEVNDIATALGLDWQTATRQSILDAIKAERAALNDALDAIKAERAALNDALGAYMDVAERTGVLNVLPGPAWDMPNIKPPGRCEVLVLRPAIWRDDIEEWEDTRTDKYLSPVVACRPAPTVTPAAPQEPTP
jgi:hypothetical protein